LEVNLPIAADLGVEMSMAWLLFDSIEYTERVGISVKLMSEIFFCKTNSPGVRVEYGSPQLF
jgi:hypothetical protein